nr:hypothetical protein [Tanacetum cinerariifolium]
MLGMHNRLFFDLVIGDRDGSVVAGTDLHDITRAFIAAISEMGYINRQNEFGLKRVVQSAVGNDNEAASSIMQKFWNSAMI